MAMAVVSRSGSWRAAAGPGSRVGAGSPACGHGSSCPTRWVPATAPGVGSSQITCRLTQDRPSPPYSLPPGHCLTSDRAPRRGWPCMQENQQLYQRLLNIRADKSIDRQELARSHFWHTQFTERRERMRCAQRPRCPGAARWARGASRQIVHAVWRQATPAHTRAWGVRGSGQPAPRPQACAGRPQGACSCSAACNDAVAWQGTGRNYWPTVSQANTREGAGAAPVTPSRRSALPGACRQAKAHPKHNTAERSGPTIRAHNDDF
jgi:hypothetical protein